MKKVSNHFLFCKWFSQCFKKLLQLWWFWRMWNAWCISTCKEDTNSETTLQTFQYKLIDLTELNREQEEGVTYTTNLLLDVTTVNLFYWSITM